MQSNDDNGEQFEKQLREILADIATIGPPCVKHVQLACPSCFGKAKACVVCGYPMRNDADGNVHWRCYRDYRDGICA